MQRLAATVLCLLACFGLLAGCSGQETGKTYVDGTYTAEFKEYDTSYDPDGYKDFIRVVVEGGKITSVEYDAINAEGNMRSMSQAYEEAMLKVSETSPSRYQADLVNQLMETGDITAVNDIAGATWSSASFKALFTALEANMVAGNTEKLIVENVPAK